MQHPSVPRAALWAFVILLGLAGCDHTTTPTRAPGPDAVLPDAELESAADEASASAVPFADAQLYFELNATDDDLGLQLFLDSEGWKRVRVLDPDQEELLLFQAEGRLARLGITELRFESVEPSPSEVLSRFPPGEYRFRGRSVEGEPLASRAVLSHDLPPAPTFKPAGGALVSRDAAFVRWDAPGAELVEIIIESDELDDVLDVTLAASRHRLQLPPQFLRPGREYKIEVLSIAENGNRTISESTFRVASD